MAAHSGERDKKTHTHTRQLAHTIPMAILLDTARFSIITFLLVLYGKRLEMENGDADGIFLHFLPTSSTVPWLMTVIYVCTTHVNTKSTFFPG